MDTVKNCFSFLDKTLNILIADDEPVILNMLLDVMNEQKLYNVFSANSAKKAQAIITSDVRIHVGILDLGLHDIGHDEFYLLKTFAPYVSCLVHTGSSEPVKGFKCKEFGAKFLIDKGNPMNLYGEAFYTLINYFALQNIINPTYSESAGGTLNHATSMLFSTSPASVTEWAMKAKITDRELRYLWKIKVGITARHALAIHSLFSLAFKCQARELSGKCSARACSISDNNKFEMLRNYYLTHQSAIKKILQTPIIPRSN
jgi:DNA-binding NarL/FixJ family response regulator